MTNKDLGLKYYKKIPYVGRNIDVFQYLEIRSKNSSCEF